METESPHTNIPTQIQQEVAGPTRSPNPRIDLNDSRGEMSGEQAPGMSKYNGHNRI